MELTLIPLDIGQVNLMKSTLYSTIVDAGMKTKIDVTDIKTNRVNRLASVERNKAQNMIEDLKYGDNMANRVRRQN